MATVLQKSGVTLLAEVLLMGNNFQNQLFPSLNGRKKSPFPHLSPKKCIYNLALAVKECRK